ncbi:MAG: hypothetical protein RJB38_1783 [Pseudomonadota bacterium]|jgi:hypothetical protein
MAVELQGSRDLNSIRGQSLIEFIFLLPLMVGMVFLLLRVNSAIQVSIVNQKYSRQRLLELVANSPQYPAVIGGPASRLISSGTNRLVVGVSEESTASGGELEVSAPVQTITRTRQAALGASDDPKEEPQKRAKVRIRNTVELCTPTLSVSVAGGKVVPIEEAMGERTFDRASFCLGGGT